MKKKKVLFPSSIQKQAPAQHESVVIRNFLINPVTHLILIFFAGAAVYGNTFSVPFVLDDVTSIYGFRPRMVGDLSFP